MCCLSGIYGQIVHSFCVPLYVSSLAKVSTRPKTSSTSCFSNQLVSGFPPLHCCLPNGLHDPYVCYNTLHQYISSQQFFFTAIHLYPFLQLCDNAPYHHVGRWCIDVVISCSKYLYAAHATSCKRYLKGNRSCCIIWQGNNSNDRSCCVRKTYQLQSVISNCHHLDRQALYLHVLVSHLFTIFQVWQLCALFFFISITIPLLNHIPSLVHLLVPYPSLHFSMLCS